MRMCVTLISIHVSAKKRMSERIILDRRFGGESSSVELVIVPKSAYFVSRCINSCNITRFNEMQLVLSNNAADYDAEFIVWPRLWPGSFMF